MAASEFEGARAELDKLSASQRREVESWLAPQTSLDSLLDELGRRQGGLKSMEEDPVERGKAIVDNLAPTIRDRVCSSDVARSLADGSNSNTGDLINGTAALASLLAPVVGSGVMSFLLGAIVLRIGLRSFCASRWSP